MTPEEFVQYKKQQGQPGMEKDTTDEPEPKTDGQEKPKGKERGKNHDA